MLQAMASIEDILLLHINSVINVHKINVLIASYSQKHISMARRST